MMRKFLIIIVLVFAYGVLQAQDCKISVKLDRQPLSMLFQEIRNKCGYNLVYSDEIISDTMLVSVNTTREPVSDLLNRILPGKELFHKMISDKMIVIGSAAMLKQQPRAAIKNSVSGVITDADANAVSFASVGLFDGDVLLASSVGGENGAYRLGYNFSIRSSYRLKVSSIGYQPFVVDFVYPDTAALKHIVLKGVQNMLKSVSVTRSRPLVERKTDRYVVNVEGSPLADGNTGLEVLRKSPGIWVNNDGSIKIKGNQSVMVMINDVVQRMSESDLAEYLRTLRSEDISKIEIISSPPSEFEAAGSGGIIHIILKKARKDGLLGSLSLLYRQQQDRPAYNGGLTFNYKRKSLYLFGSISAGKDESDYIASTKIRYADQSYYASSTDRYNNNARFMYRAGAAYDLAANQSLSIQTIQTSNKLNQYFDTGINFQDEAEPLTGAASSEWFRRPVLSSTTLNYSLKTDSLGSGLKIIGDYIYSKKTELNKFVSSYSIPQKNSDYRNNTPNNTDLYSIQTDFTKVFRKGLEFKTGLKFAATNRDNEVLNENYVAGNWVLNPSLSNRFIYKEYLSMAYASMEKTMGKVSAKLGLRAEHTRMDGNSVTAGETFNRNYLSLFPSLFMQRRLNESKGSAVYLSYSRRLQRPSFADLNPYRLQFDDYLTQLGNPDLLPEYTHKLELGASFWNSFSADIYYAFTSDKIAQLASPVKGNVIEYQTRNFNNSKEYGFSLNAPLKITKWWTANNALAAYNLKYTLNDFRIRQTTFYANSQHSLKAGNLADLDISVYYTSPYVNANTHVAYQFSADMAISRRFFKKSALLRFYVSDLFNTARERDYTDYSGTRIDFYQKRPTQTFSLAFSYNFSSGKKFSSKKIEQSNDDEKRRIGN